MPPSFSQVRSTDMIAFPSILASMTIFIFLSQVWPCVLTHFVAPVSCEPETRMSVSFKSTSQLRCLSTTLILTTKLSPGLYFSFRTPSTVTNMSQAFTIVGKMKNNAVTTNIFDRILIMASLFFLAV